MRLGQKEGLSPLLRREVSWQNQARAGAAELVPLNALYPE